MSELFFEFVRLELANQLGRDPSEAELEAQIGSRNDDHYQFFTNSIESTLVQ